MSSAKQRYMAGLERRRELAPLALVPFAGTGLFDVDRDRDRIVSMINSLEHEVTNWTRVSASRHDHFEKRIKQIDRHAGWVWWATSGIVQVNIFHDLSRLSTPRRIQGNLSHVAPAPGAATDKFKQMLAENYEVPVEDVRIVGATFYIVGDGVRLDGTRVVLSQHAILQHKLTIAYESAQGRVEK